MKNFMSEFKKFIARGNVMDMAVGMIIGSAFTSIVSSFVEDIINPVLGLFGGANFDQFKLPLGGEVTLNYGKFITAVINFLIMALVLFTMVRIVNKTTKKFTNQPEEKKAPTTKKCPYCQSTIDIQATRCPHCTSTLDEESKIA